MSATRRARRFAIGFFILYAVAVVYPGVALFRGPRPFILGLPLAMAWTAAWVVAAFLVLLRLDRAYGAAERAHDEGWFGYDATDPGTGASGRTPDTRPPTSMR